MRLLRGSLLGMVAALALVLPAAAGGWATATVDSGPIDPTAGTPVEIGFMLKQHGETPIHWEMATFVGTNAGTGATVSAEAQPKGPLGHYVATVTFPSEGSWSWTVQLRDLLLDTSASSFPTITVRPAAAVPTSPAGIPIEMIVAAAVLALGLLLVGSLLVRRQQAPVPAGRAAAETQAQTAPEIG